MSRISLCAFCRHRSLGRGVVTCAAYPDGIPDDFLFGRRQHVEPAEGDHGIQFEPAEGQERSLFVLHVLQQHARRPTARARRNPPEPGLCTLVIPLPKGKEGSALLVALTEVCCGDTEPVSS